MNNPAIDYRNPVMLRKMGIEALSKALSPVGMAYFYGNMKSAKGIIPWNEEKC
ncbi:MAG: hypothetical protein LBB91_05150 [Clostridiales bacterium]|jgi:hypothetical protein|nr:hypothetical protein [Clostridiales bacterium]